MFDQSNPFDEPAPLCPGSPGSDGNPQNMSWFAFVAGSTSSVLEIVFTNCQGGSAVQYGVYEDCSFSNYVSGACEGDPQSVANPITISMSDLVPGDNYYLFIDGDLGTQCDYSVEVISGGEPIPVPQPTGINCVGCPPDNTTCETGNTYTFMAEGLDLTIDYIWTVDPSPPNGITVNGINNADFTFNSPGEYEICLTATNGCTTTDEVCTIFTVLEADAGVLDAMPEVLCPGGTSTVTATGFVASPPLMQTMIAVDPDGEVIGVQDGGAINVTLDVCGTVTVFSYNYDPMDSPAVPALGSIFSMPNCAASCCDVESIEVDFEDSEDPVFVNLPPDITLDCGDPIPDPIAVTWSDNCDGTGDVMGTQIDNFNTCDGGDITRTWEYTDGCMNTVSESQVITINGQTGGSFTSMPDDQTLDCAGDIPTPVDLIWEGDCDGTATVTPIDAGDSDLCAGGVRTRTWSFTDMCGNPTEYVQTFTINPSTGGDFVDAPAGASVSCDLSDLAPIMDLVWEGDCEGTAIVSGSEIIDVDPCGGGTVTRTWMFTDLCGVETDHTQIILVDAPPAAMPVNPPNPNIFVDCGELPTTFPDLQFDNGQAGDCSIQGVATPEIQGTPSQCGGSFSVLWIFTDDCNIPHTYVQNITVSPVETPMFVDSPADITISCLEPVPDFDDLPYTNNGTGSCEIVGLAEPSTNVDGDICGGDIVAIWLFEDPCAAGTFIEHIQTVTIEPISEAEWVDPPMSVSMACADGIPVPVDLAYTNGGSGTCEIIGSITPTQSGSADICGGEIVYTWEFTDDCGRMLMHEQTIIVAEADAPDFVNPPGPITIGCDEIPPSPPSLMYTNNSLPDCLIEGSQTPTIIDNSNSCGGTITYQWIFTDPCGRNISHNQVITITQAPQASYVDAPPSVTVSCNNIPAPASELMYTNSDPCEIMGSTIPVVVEDYDICGGTITNTWTFIDACGRTLNYEQVITIEPAPIAMFDDAPMGMTVSCGDEATIPGPLSYSNGETGDCAITGQVDPAQTGGFDECGGDVTFTWSFIDACGRTIQTSQTIVIQPSSAAIFFGVPDDTTVSCADFQTTPPDLSYSNAEADVCEISGMAAGTLVGAASPCGNTVMYRWQFTDDCGRSIIATQNITVEQAPVASFISPPGPITLDCADVPSSAPTLSYTNNATGVCAIQGSVNGIQSGVFDACGGNISYSWTFTDACNRPITHSQPIVVNPAPEPTFTSLPPDVTLDCGEDFPTDPTLDYTNASAGACTVAGTVIATSSQIDNIVTYSWSFTNNCSGETISHEQNVTGVPTPEITIDPTVTTICLGETYDLDDITVTDANANVLTISYLDQTGTPLGSSLVSPAVSTTYTVSAANAAGCTDEAVFTINVDQPPTAGVDGSGLVCSGGGLTFNLFDYLTGTITAGGTWFDTDGSGANIDNPTNASFANVQEGTYIFTYSVFSTNSCPNAEAVAEVQVIGMLDFEILAATCEPGGATYTVTVLSNGNNIFASLGTVVTIDVNNTEITGIPIDQLVVVSAIDPNAFCISDMFVNPPDCDCPTVAPPISGGNLEICEGEVVPELAVSLPAGFTANWYDVAGASTAVLENSLVYIPTIAGPGTYTFFVEAVDADGCVSLLRTQISLQVFSAPTIVDIDTLICADATGMITIQLSTLDLLINSNANFTVMYYGSLADAESETNVLDDIYEATSTTTIFSVVTNSTGCSTIGEVALLFGDQVEFNIVGQNEVCLDDANGQIDISGTSPSGTEFSIDGVSYSSMTIIPDLISGSYTVYGLSPDGCETSQDINIDQGEELELAGLVIDCNDNGTDSDSSDDFYTIAFMISNTSSMATAANISSGGTDYGDFLYGMVAFEVPIGSSIDIDVTDSESGCSISFATGDLNPCSSSCVIAIDELTATCQDGGTDSDPTDDTYDIFVNASAINGAANGNFNVTVDGAIIASFAYGTGGTISIPALSQSPMIGVVDNADNQCFTSQVIGPLAPCSSSCILTIDNTNFICDGMGTVGVPADDIYTFSFTVLATNAQSNSYELFIDGSSAGLFTYGTSSSVVLPADGLVRDIRFVDSTDDSCVVEMMSPALSSCSGSCTISVVAQDPICDNGGTGLNDTDDTFTASIFVNLIGGSGTWQIAETGQQGSAGETVVVGPFSISAGDAMLTISDLTAPDCDTLLVIVPPMACSSCDGSVEAGEDWVLDCSIVVADLTGVTSSGIAGTWSGPGGFSFAGSETTTNLPGVYYFSADFGEGCVFTDSLVVSVSADLPTASAGEDQVITCVKDSAILEGAVIGGSGNFEYQWLDAAMVELATGTELIVYESGTYFFVAYDVDTDCMAPAAVVNVLDETDPIFGNIIVDPDNVLNCVVELITLSTTTVPDVLYSWYVDGVLVANNQESIIVQQQGLIRLELRDTITGCEGASEIFVEDLEEYPIVNISADGELNCEQETISIDGSSSQMGANISYTWLDENGTIIAIDVTAIDVGAEGTYYLQLIDVDNSCTNTDTLLVTANLDPPEISVEDEVNIGCGDATNTISVDAVDPDAIYSYMWQTSDGVIISANDIAEITIGSAGTYTVIATNVVNLCQVESSTVVISTEGVTDSEVVVMDESCEDVTNGSITIASVLGGTEPYRYFIDEIEVSTNTISDLAAGTYQILIVDADGCAYDIEAIVDVQEGFNVSLLSEVTLSLGQSQQLLVDVNIPAEEIETVVWSPAVGLSCADCLDPIVTTDGDISYTVTVTDIYGCSEEATIDVRTTDQVIITVPNIINPNSEGSANSNFTIYSSIEATILRLSIYDRWGNQVFSTANIPTNNPTLGWNGQYGNSKIAPGVYVFLAEVLIDGEVIAKHGDITVL